MQLLISVTDAAEARAALAGGATIIDIKNPAEGALGAAAIAALCAVAPVLPADIPLSAALGETGAQAGQVALAAYAAASLGARYIKLGLRTHNRCDALVLLRALREGATLANPACRTIVVGYADAERVGALPWNALPPLAREAGAAGCLLDTAIKDGRGLFDYCPENALAAWIATCREQGLLAALAGTLTVANLPVVRRLAPDIVGFRSAACRGDRVHGRVDQELVAVLRAGLSEVHVVNEQRACQQCDL